MRKQLGQMCETELRGLHEACGIFLGTRQGSALTKEGAKIKLEKSGLTDFSETGVQQFCVKINKARHAIHSNH